MKPITKYAKNGAINIAYQVVGDGAVDLIYVPGWVSNIDMMWVDSKIGGFLTDLSQFARVILFDKRGTGLSDRVSPLCTLEERMTDILSVMAAVSSKKAHFFGHSEGGTIALLFAATYPEYVHSIITFGVFASRKYAPDYPWGPTAETRQVFYNFITSEWGNGQKMGLECIMPSMAHDKTYYHLFASYLRSGAGPGDALALAKMNTESDIRDILPSITVPTLILHREDEPEVQMAEAEYLAARIPNATLVRLKGIDHCFWVGDAFSVLAEIQAFITGHRPRRAYPPRVGRTVHYSKIDIEATMMQNFKFNLTLEEFATLCGRSLSAFKRDFRSQLQMTPFQWLKQKRLAYAKSLLLESDLNVTQICYESGFINVSHFVRAFREAFKQTPLQYRSRPSEL